MSKQKSYYQEIIIDILEKQDVRDVDPRHVEAWMRVEHATLDALANWQWEKEVALSVMCAREAGKEDSERLAESHGLFPHCTHCGESKHQHKDGYCREPEAGRLVKYTTVPRIWSNA